MHVGKRITELRELRKISTNKLANLAGISQSHLRAIELEKKNPTVETLSYLCDALNITLSEFFSTPRYQIDPHLLSVIEQLNEQEQWKLAEFLMEIKRKP